MRTLAVSMHCELAPTGEPQDSLDPRWPSFLSQLGLQCVPIPNALGTANALLESEPIQGVLLTGGADLSRYGGKFPQRDAVESRLLTIALERGLPLLGVGRGMQLIQTHFGVPLKRVFNHPHSWGASGTVPQLAIWSQSPDGVVKAVRHTRLPIVGVMWHPEHRVPFAPEDQTLFGEFFGA